MKLLVVFCILGGCSLCLKSQNLVPNPSFEEYTSCPISTWSNNSIIYALNWSTPTLSTDYFHACTVDPLIAVPQNFKGYQNARTGEGYAGIFVYIPPIWETPYVNTNKEYLSNMLATAMEKDSIYQVKLFVSLSDNSDYACDCMEVWLTDYQVEVPLPFQDSFLIEGYPQLTTPQGYYLTDTANWMELCWLYKAKGGEQYMIIGNFKENAAIDAVMVGPVIQDPSTYYYIDDVSIEKVPYHLAAIGLGGDRVVCQASFTDTLTAHGFYTSYLWSTGDTVQSIIVTEPGTYWVEASKGLCKMRDTLEIVHLDPQNLTLGADQAVCPQDFPLEIAGPDYMISYQWSTGDMTPQIWVNEPGQYVLEAPHACGFFKDTIIIASLATAIDLGHDTTLCGQPVFQRTLTAPSGYDSYLWSNGDTLQSIEITTPGAYWVQATNICGVLSDTIQIVNQPLLTLDLGADTTRCIEGGFVLSAGQGFEEYTWNTGTNAPFLDVTSYGTYFVQASYACGILSDTINITEPPPLVLALPGDATIYLGENIQIQTEIIASTPVSYQWTPEVGLSCTDCPSPVASPIKKTIYTLSIEDDYGCRVADAMAINVKNLERIYVPNAFSPNEDAINDIFSVYGGPEVLEIVSWRIYDRWGEMVFSAEHLLADGSVGWNGQFKGKDALPGVYAFVLQVVFLDGTHKQITGDITLVR
ncbi:MAG: gliding motility-associated C-terminal domain-containing protein [Saprospiraceae bacterium]|nr:MAG: gliding motility-associated C-terminal domain-containing protein [Saprospiraceae bacterium]